MQDKTNANHSPFKIGYIVKSWGADYPQLAANEFLCMTAAQRAGLPVPEFHLSENGGLFVMKRFDIAASDGSLLSFEDMCYLQALGAAQKYNSTCERVARTIKDFVSGEFLYEAREQFFASLVLSCMIRNGDAHLKNFGVLYERPGHTDVILGRSPRVPGSWKPDAGSLGRWSDGNLISVIDPFFCHYLTLPTFKPLPKQVIQISSNL